MCAAFMSTTVAAVVTAAADMAVCWERFSSGLVVSAGCSEIRQTCASGFAVWLSEFLFLYIFSLCIFIVRVFFAIIVVLN